MKETDKRGKVIALGFFDGVHIGHGALLRQVGEVASQLGAVPAACTFDTHPESLIRNSPTPLLTTPAVRAELMRRYYGIQEVIIVHFDQRMMRMPWREFVTEFLVREHQAVHLVAGHDFHFGYKGEGSPERLVNLCQELGLGCDIIPKVEREHITVSSTYVRSLVAQGELERAAAFLGHPHTLEVTAEPAPGGLTLGLSAQELRPAPGRYEGRLTAGTHTYPVDLCVTDTITCQTEAAFTGTAFLELLRRNTGS